MWKLADIIPIPKPNKNNNLSISYQPTYSLAKNTREDHKSKHHFNPDEIFAFDTVNIHELINKLIHSHTITKFIANYIIAFHKGAFFHPQSLTYAPQTYQLLPNAHN